MKNFLPQTAVLLLLCFHISFIVSAQTPGLNVNGEVHTIGYTGNAQSFKIPEFDDLNNMNRVTFFLRGGDGGKRKVLGTTKKGGGGAKVTATFKVGYGPNELRPGSEVRFIVGEEGTSYTGSAVAGAGGGGGTAVLYTNGFNCPPAPPQGLAICLISGFIDNVTTGFSQEANWYLLAVAGGGGGAYASGLTDGSGGKSANADECGDKGNGDGKDAGKGGCNGQGGKSAVNNIGGLELGDIEIAGNSTEVLSGGGGGAFSNGVGNATYDFIGKMGGKDGGAGGSGGVVDRINSNRKYTRVSGGYGYGGGGSGQRIAIGTVFTFAAGGGGGGGYSGGGGGAFDSGGGGGSFVNSIAASFDKEGGNKDGSPNDGKITYQFFRDNPVVAVCDNQTVILDANGNGQLNAADVLANSYVIDDASATFESFCFGTESSPCTTTRSFGCDDLGSSKWISAVAKDNGSGEDVCYFFVSVIDTIAPEVTCPTAPLTIGITAGGSRFIAASDFAPTSTDLCGDGTQFSLSQNEFRCTDAGPNLLTLYATDESDNIDSCTVTLNVNVNNDNTPPVANCRNITVDIGEIGTVTYSLAYLAGNSTDNCSIASYSSTKKVCDPLCVDVLITEEINFDCDDVGTNNYNIKVIDYNGNSSTCTATVTVLDDTTPPNAICQDQTVYLNAKGEASVALASLAAQSTDNCSIANYSSKKKVCNPLCVDVLITEAIDFDCDDLGAKSFIITVADGNGNASNCTSTITVVDNQAPTTQCEAITVSIGADGQVNVPLSALAGTSTDNCSIAYSTIVEVCNPDCADILVTNQLSFACDELGDYSYDLTMTDPAGNSSNCAVGLTVVDDTPPTAICENPTIQLDDNGEAEITLADLTVNSSDNCGIASYKSTFKVCSPLCVDFTVLEEFEFDCDDLGEKTYNIKITDVNGNTSQCTTTITIEDITSPNLECQNLTVQLDEAGNATVNPAALASVASDICGELSLSLSQTSFDCTDRGGKMLTLTATDRSGNSSECLAALTIEDSVAPSPSCQDITVQLDANGDGAIVAADIDAGSSDACGILDLSLSSTDFDCSQIGGNLVTLTVLDVAGNSSSCEATVTVVDGVSPLAICQDEIVQLDINGEGSISPEDINNGSNDACGIADLSLSQTAFDCMHVGDNMVTLTVTDENGNSSTCSATVRVEDHILPEALCQAVTVQLDANGEASISVADIDTGSNDACGIAALSLDQTDFDCSQVGDNTVSLTVVDENSNSASCSAVVTVEDNIAPIIDCFDHTIVFNGEDMIILDQLDLVESSDNCEVATTVLSITDIACAEVGNTIPVDITVTDINGNTSDCSVTVTVNGLPCGYSQDPDGVNCNSGSSADYDPSTEIFDLTSTDCYFGSPFNSDKEAFIEYELCGNGELIAQINAITGIAWAGLQFRESMDATSKKFSLASNGSNFARRETRSQTGGTAFPQQFPVFGKTWIKLVRQGNQFQGYLSNNGLVWQLVMTANIQMNNCIMAGLFMTNLTPNGTSSASFSHVSFNSSGSQTKQTGEQNDLKSFTAKEKRLNIFPNPSSGRVVLDLSVYQNQTLSLDLINQFGQVLQSRNYLDLNIYFEELDLSAYPAGLYFIRLYDAEGHKQLEKVILQTRP